MMKKIGIMILMVTMIVSIVACSPQVPEQSKIAESNETQLPEPKEDKPMETVPKSENGEPAVSEEEVMNYLLGQVKEIEVYNKQVVEYSKQNNAPEDKPIMRIDATPDPAGEDDFQKDYYAVYVGEMRDNHTNRFATFLVKSDLSEILVEDVLTGDYISLKDWRKANGND